VLTSIVVQIVRACTRFATLTVLLGLILAIAAGYYTSQHFVINTDINTLISSKLDWRQRDQQFDKEFDRDSTILAVVEAPTPELTGAAATALEQKLKGDKKNFQSMQPLGSGEFFDKNGLLFLPTDEVGKVTGEFAAAAPLIEAWAEGYSGKAGVPGLKKSSHGSHVGSASAGVRPSRIAVIGRQKLYRYLESQQAMTASAMVTFNKANRWTFSWNDSLRSAEIWTATRSQVSGVLLCQKSVSSD